MTFINLAARSYKNYKSTKTTISYANLPISKDIMILSCRISTYFKIIKSSDFMANNYDFMFKFIIIGDSSIFVM